MNEKRSKILLVDDHAVVRYGIAQLIDKQKDLVVCGEAADAAAALGAVATLKPDAAVVDLSLKESSGLELIKTLKALHPKLPVLALSMHDELIYGEMALRAGAMGYLMKEEAIERMVPAIRRVLSGKAYLSEQLSGKVLLQLRSRTGVDTNPLERLTDRELEVFLLIGQWKGTRQIASTLHLSIKTVESHREHIKEKLGVHNASELVQYATRWIQPT